MTLYARAIMLRNCGRFTMIASDFGGDYRTQTHVTSQALYASLTRGATWCAGSTVEGHPVYPAIRVRKDRYDFAVDYDLNALPIWFTPGLFVNRNGNDLSDQALDAGYFNVVHECYPSTSKQFKFNNKGQLKSTNRPSQVPTYGTWQGILPDQRLRTIALAFEPRLLKRFEAGQTYLLGKKRTMMQITEISKIIKGEEEYGTCQAIPLQLSPNEVTLFRNFRIIAATMRYLILEGKTRDKEKYIKFNFETMHSIDKCSIPQFYIGKTPLG